MGIRALYRAHKDATTAAAQSAVSSDSQTSSAGAKTPTSIFSLPPELLDQIFAYLLDPEYARYDPYDASESKHLSEAYNKHGGCAHTYRFHPNILQVNKALGAAAAHFWHSRCTFILIRYKCAGLTAMLHRMDVPIVADRKLKKARHCFGIMLEWSVGPFSTITGTRRAKMKSPKRGEVLLLQADLDRLLKLLNFHCSFLAPKRTTIVGGHEPMVTKAMLSKYTPLLVPVFPSDAKRPKPVSYADWANFVSNFRDINGFRLRPSKVISKKGATVYLSVENTIPNIIWPRALWWDRFEAALSYKLEADKFALAGRYEAARARYEFLVCWSECESTGVLHKLDISRDSALLAALERWLLLIFDCCVSQSWLHLRLQNVDAQYPRCGHRLTSILVKLETVWGGARSPTLDSIWSHVVLLAVVCILSKGRKSNAARVPMIASELIMLRKTWGQEIKEHEAHDHLIVENAITQATQSGTKLEMPMDQLSAKVLPVRIFNSQTEAKMPGRPEGLIGWQDTEHLANLTEDEQKAIAEIQKKVSKYDLTL